MAPISRPARFALLLVPLSLCVLAGAPPQAESPDDLIRRANDAFRAGEKDAADTLYTLAEQRTDDPGLVAFNRGAVAFDRKQWREAEVCYERTLKDAACPPERAAKAWYNRGTCLLWGGDSIEAYRAAVACFEHTLDSAAADEHLKSRARDNLERAKLLWNNERKKKENQKKTPNDDVPREEQDRPQPQPNRREDGTDPNPAGEPDAKKDGTTPRPAGTRPDPQPAGDPTKTDKTTPGNNTTLQPLNDTEQVQSFSEKDARANLAEAAKRIKREQQSLMRALYGPDRPGVRDW